MQYHAFPDLIKDTTVYNQVDLRKSSYQLQPFLALIAVKELR